MGMGKAHMEMGTIRFHLVIKFPPKPVLDFNGFRVHFTVLCFDFKV